MASKELGKIRRYLEDHGWTCTQRRRGGHWRIAGPAGQLVVISASPSDPRALNNIRADLRRAGAPLPAKG
jgi:predicted RNA binding protein YcfA (HicA-like mRNA interferase family)